MTSWKSAGKSLRRIPTALLALLLEHGGRLQERTDRQGNELLQSKVALVGVCVLEVMNALSNKPALHNNLLKGEGGGGRRGTHHNLFSQHRWRYARKDIVLLNALDYAFRLSCVFC